MSGIEATSDHSDVLVLYLHTRDRQEYLVLPSRAPRVKEDT